MSIRTDHDAVEAVLGTTVASGALDSHIETASLWVDNYLEGRSCIDADKLTTIETYLAAHLYAQSTSGGTGPVIARQRADISERYASPSQAKVGESPYVHTAAAFDSCGQVAKYWLGRPRLAWRVGAGYDERHTGGGST